ncbi:MAG: hypothetical protein M0R76_14285 [Proteobacteria bacterium]|nr:hypothetical protein [Pseudomonadota bacterium]
MTQTNSRRILTVAAALAAALACLALPGVSRANTGDAQAAFSLEDASSSRAVLIGFKLRAGGRFDNVRMCIGSPPGVKGGPAMDVSLYVEFALDDDISLAVDLPVMRPIMFAFAFQMLQFEPQLTLLFRHRVGGNVDFVGGPSIGVSLHYGPDYHSARSGRDRGKSFFAAGPMFGGYMGFDFKRPQKNFHYQLGLAPYLAPMLGIHDPDEHRGFILGGTIDNVFIFR